MGNIIRGTTPTFTLTVPEAVDLTAAQNVYATFRQGAKVCTKSGDEITVSEHQVDIYLDQGETLAFTVGEVEIQLNWTFAGGQRAASTITKVTFDENLLRRVIE